MNSNNLRLMYIGLGALMLVLLQTNIFQDAIGLINLIGIAYIPYIGEIVFLLSKILSFIGVIIFIAVSLTLISNNIKDK
ncbi:MAG: hypothetical protein ACRDB0_07430 [Paraclostridium sp.]